LYTNRAGCENGFDELKNQWGWGGYTTHDLERCNLSARAVALIYNGWSWYVRLAHPKAHLETITSRPLLLCGVARLTQHVGQSRLLFKLSHAAGDQIMSMIANIRTGFDHVRATAPQLPKPGRWSALVCYIVDRIIAAKPKNPPPLGLLPPWLAADMSWLRNLGLFFSLATSHLSPLLIPSSSTHPSRSTGASKSNHGR
jgi:hypothetical protein